jgi:hypothetical protein
MKPEHFAASQDHYNKMINETLHAIGNVTPHEGIEGRIAIGIAHARQEDHAKRRPSWSRMLWIAASSGIACAAIVTGSVYHSRSPLPASPNGDIRLGAPSGGMGAASAAHLATQEVTPSGRPRAARKGSEGRATVKSGTQKHAGVSVPEQP